MCNFITGRPCSPARRRKAETRGFVIFMVAGVLGVLVVVLAGASPIAEQARDRLFQTFAKG